ncbi:hypothetical protein ACA910_021333 [Epithemia clementina (nom. ined.)]
MKGCLHTILLILSACALLEQGSATTSSHDGSASTEYCESVNGKSGNINTQQQHQQPLLYNPTVRLHNGVEMPILQLGTAQLVVPDLAPDLDAPPNFVGMQPERGYRQIQVALQAGMRAFDTALIYRSHAFMAHVFGEWFRTGQLKARKEIWITSKILHPRSDDCFGISHMPDYDQLSPEQVSVRTREHFEQALAELKIGYIDLMLLHWPGVWPENNENENENDTKDRRNSTEIEASVQWNRQKRLAAWKVLEEMYDKGWCRAIGVSNYGVKHLEQLQHDGAKIVPMVNQIEASVEFQQVAIREYCQQHGIVVQAYSTLRGAMSNNNNNKQEPPRRRAIPIILQTLSQKYQKDVGQVVFRYLYQHGYAVIYLTNSEPRMVSNADIWDFELTPEEMKAIDDLNRPDGSWGLPNPNTFD